MRIPGQDPRAVTVESAIRRGDVEELTRWLVDNPELAKAMIVDSEGTARSLLHIATDWPGHFPNGPRVVAALVAAGADANAKATSPAREAAETPLHWAASSNDVTVIDALLEAGADIEALGAVLTGGTPMSDAVVFAQWEAAHRLLEHGAQTTIWQAAALGLLDRVQECFAAQPRPSAETITNAFWHACRGGRRSTAEYLLDRGADLDWIGHDECTPLEVARQSGDSDLIEWLTGKGAKTSGELRQ